MKKLSMMLVLALAVSAASAQYKKASFFTKGGRTYAVGATTHIMGDGKGSPIGYYFSGGVDRTDSRFMLWYELTAIPSYKYSYLTTAFNSDTQQEEAIKISGKSRFHLLYNYNVGFHLLDRSEQEKKIQPFVVLGINVVALGKAEEPEVDYKYSEIKKRVSTSGFGIGLRGGTGAIYAITENIGIKVYGGYNWQYNWNGSETYGTNDYYHMFTSNAFASAGVQFRISED